MKDRHRILLVDDNEANLALMEALLAPHGYETVLARNGKEALAVVAREEIDLILLDLMMPEIDGIEVCRRLKEDEATRFIPIIIVTALHEEKARLAGIEAGADDFLIKPINELELSTRIRSLLRTKDLNDRVLEAQFRIRQLNGHTLELLKNFDPLRFQLEKALSPVITSLLEGKSGQQKPTAVFVAFRKEGRRWEGNLYHWANGSVKLGGQIGFEQEWIEWRPDLNRLPGALAEEDGFFFNQASGFFSENAWKGAKIKEFFQRLLYRELGAINNFVFYQNGPVLLMALNYPGEVTVYDLETFKGLLALSHLLKIVADQLKEVTQAFRYLIGALARAAEASDEDTGSHILRVGAYAEAIARELGSSPEFAEEIGYAAQSHDVGKIHIPLEILRKPGQLSPEEWELMKQHTWYGAKILGDSPRLAIARDIALQHHEKWDGSGYPQGLKGDQIALSARIVALADIYDALRSPRPYKPPFSHAQAHQIILRGDGRVKPSHFDPDVLAAYKRLSDTFADIYRTMSDSAKGS